MKSALNIHVQGNTVYVNGVTFGICENYKGNNRVRVWLHGSPAEFTILENSPDALKNFIIARRRATKNMKT